jgi:hypothetical protein
MPKRTDRIPLRRLKSNPLFKEAHLDGRFQDVYLACERFVEAVNARAPLKIGFDPAILYVVVVSTYHDIARYKLYHLDDPLNELSDAVKRAAYFTKWLVRLRPISGVRGREGKSSFHDDDAIVLMNEGFAIAWALANLSADFYQKQMRLTDEKWSDMLYELVFRDISADALLSLYQTYVEIAEGRYPIHVA